jgi:hypothetical protein
MKKIILLVIFMFTIFGINAENIKQIGQVNLDSSIIVVSVKPERIFNMSISNISINLDERQLNLFLQFSESHQDLMQTVDSEKLNIVYRRYTGQMVTWKSKQTLRFVFYSPGTGVQDCIWSIIIIDRIDFTNKVITLSINQIQELESLLKESITVVNDIKRQVTLLDNKVEEINKIY